MNNGVRTWRLGLLFFAGIGGAIAILDALSHDKENLTTESIGYLQILSLPLIHIFVFSYIAFARLCDEWIHRRWSVQLRWIRILMTMLCFVLYLLATYVSVRWE